MEEKEKKEKTPAHISQHEDTVLKATAQFFQEEIMPVLNIEGTVVSVLPTEGINTYRIQPIIMKGKNADAVIAELKRKIETKEELTKADLLPLVLCPLMGGAMSQKERISAAYDITRNATGTDAEVIRKVEALVYVMADKFLEKAEMEQLKKEIKMTALGKMLYDDGVKDGEKLGEARGEARGKQKSLIEVYQEDGKTREETVKRFMLKFQTSRQEAEEKVKEYWK